MQFIGRDRFDRSYGIIEVRSGEVIQHDILPAAHDVKRAIQVAQDGTDQVIPDQRQLFFVNRLFPGNRGFLRERYLDRDRSVPFDVEQPAAAALLVRRDVFEKVGGFDPVFAPAWFEDVDLCAKILESGYRIRFVPAARASHVGGTTMRALPYDDYLPLYTRNLLLYLRRRAGPATRAGARAVLFLGALLRLALLPLVRGDHARPEAARAYARVLRGLLGLGFASALLPRRA